jgi:hypothetical protein
LCRPHHFPRTARGALLGRTARYGFSPANSYCCRGAAASKLYRTPALSIKNTPNRVFVPGSIPALPSSSAGLLLASLLTRFYAGPRPLATCCRSRVTSWVSRATVFSGFRETTDRFAFRPTLWRMRSNEAGSIDLRDSPKLRQPKPIYRPPESTRAMAFRSIGPRRVQHDRTPTGPTRSDPDGSNRRKPTQGLHRPIAARTAE